jgi:hypothetical protein
MAWSGFLALGNVASGVFTDLGLVRQPFTFSVPTNGAVYGNGSAVSFGSGPIASHNNGGVVSAV